MRAAEVNHLGAMDGGIAAHDSREATAPQAPAVPNPQSHAYWATLLFIAGYFIAAVACLWQWHSPRPWERLDIFSTGFLVVSLVWGCAMMRFHRSIFRSREVMEEAAGVTYDPWMLRWITIFAIAELTVFLDYGHWHLVPQLLNPVLQTIGLVLYLAGAVWLIWTDRYLAKVFAGDLSERKVMTKGPYRFVRHPRYAALIASRIAFALTLGSILAWFFFFGWLWVNLRRVQLEEDHLRKLFGADYEKYAAKTARFLPGIY
jgi:protein-S-isoprenylcysteine O-methyltransferase Ste14